ncbi:MAG: hypothetical protein KJ917_01240 [Proteobacteria bacterium]|uniref:Uncharacterized protein n=2 Tax=Pseudodesulfovibrio aespoeensis TaxID=182210 RepID=E6VU82_PSEA9|nr:MULTISPECIES: hypothetical protein [Pseudodesulfovibrio]MBU4243437.1 hypothetical protein [Pseudomonadota bacterium]ADU63389.1 hypothetical protein Daes_2384 [Pseudodesulfovibrio aespoeensis Aspo-2]MBU4517247.1 hypothetical protein [Pseudomonadota bacterium]MBU4520895.1 hypothetical protein [Pseudomonadota bacterium]MBU4560105.1 hypothetical protein [Pseudomonadota bacterium]
MSRLAFGGQGKSGIEGKYKFVPLPWTEDGANDATYVCEFTGAAGANEVGVGGGLTGADLVLTQNANPGSDGTYRTIQDGTFQSFYGTMAFYNAFAQAPLGWSMVLRHKNLVGSNAYLVNLLGQDAAGFQAMDLRLLKNSSTFTLSAGSSNNVSGLGVGLKLPATNELWPVTGQPYMTIASLDYAKGICFAGILQDNEVFPSKLTDFLTFSINQFSEDFAGPNQITAYNAGVYKCILGSFLSYGSNYSGGQTVKSLTLAKRPCYIPA